MQNPSRQAINHKSQKEEWLCRIENKAYSLFQKMLVMNPCDALCVTPIAIGLAVFVLASQLEWLNHFEINSLG